jgi:CBS domain-containing protein
MMLSRIITLPFQRASTAGFIGRCGGGRGGTVAAIRCLSTVGQVQQRKQKDQQHQKNNMNNNKATAKDAADASCYDNADYCINELSSVSDAVQRLCAYNIGCLVAINDRGDVTGVISERDYISKIEPKGLDPSSTLVKDIFASRENLITAIPSESVEACMTKMLDNEIRHLPILCGNNNKDLLGMISIKDLVKVSVQEKEETIQVLSNFALGKGSYSM